MKENKDRSKFEDVEKCIVDEGLGDKHIECNVISGGTFRLIMKPESYLICFSSLWFQFVVYLTAEKLQNPQKKLSNAYDDEVSEFPYLFLLYHDSFLKVRFLPML